MATRAGDIAPGVHFEEVAPRGRPVLQTGVPLFVGFGEASGKGDCEEGTANGTKVFRFRCWQQFEQCIEPESLGGFLDYAVRGFFENGGESCVVIAIRTVKASYPRNLVIENLFAHRGPLEDIEEADLVCVPDIMMDEIRRTPNMVLELQQHVVEYCRRMQDRFAILDSAFMDGADENNIKPRTAQDRHQLVDRALAWQSKIPRKGLPVDGAVYFPWIRVKPFARHKHRVSVNVPPSGHVAGVYARTDAAVGVHKAPANEIVVGALNLETHLTDEDQIPLNEFGVNCLRSFPGRGIRVWGARTLSGQPNWKYVNVRRLFLTLVRWCDRNMGDLVFEPNGRRLWDRVRDRLGGYCYELYRRGALKGRAPAEAYFVKCDAETNPLEIRAVGQLICEVGLALVTPAEFVVVRITQSAAGTTATTPTGT